MMKAKMTIFGMCVVATLASFAASVASVTVTNRLAVLRVDSSAEETIVAVPWVAAGGGAIAASNVVKTANLEVGDQLYYYTGEGYKTWSLALDSSSGVKYWEPVAVVSGNNKLTIAAAANTETLARGGALLLKRPLETRADHFYLYGEVSTEAVATPITGGTAEAPVYNLIAPPCVKSSGTINLNDASDVTWANVTGYTNGAAMGDCIILVGSDLKTRRCYYHDGAWQYMMKVNHLVGTRTIIKTLWVSAPKVTCGTGFWYVSTSATVPTIVWGNLPAR